MTTHNLSSSFLLPFSSVLFAFGFSSPQSAHAALAVYEQTPTVTWLNGGWNVSKFNNQAGSLTLTSVSLQFAAQSNFRIHNTSTEAATLSGLIQVSFTINGIDGNGPDNFVLSAPSPPALIQPGGISDYISLVTSHTLYSSDLGRWQIPAGSDTIFLPTLVIVGFGLNSATKDNSFEGNTTASLLAKYTYVNTMSEVPEPSFYGAMGALVCIGFYAYQHYRGRKLS